MEVLFNNPYLSGKELDYISETCKNLELSGNNTFTKKCQKWLEVNLSCPKALLTHSCTAALEMAALLIDVQPGDEIIMPSFTFVSTANAFVLRGGIPVFVDIREDTLNLDEKKIEAAITSKTKAIVPVHYAGVGCEMDTIMDIAKKHNLYIIEDAAQGILSNYKNRVLGTIGHLAAFSFHETKNITSGEGGALIINDPQFIERAEIIWEKGTNRTQFYRGEIDKYTWIDIGSSYLPNELTSAFLFAQLECAKDITAKRLESWDNYHRSLAILEEQHQLRRPIIPEECTSNGHIYYIIASDFQTRCKLIETLNKNNIAATFHYIPLHLAPMGKKTARMQGNLKVTEYIAERLLRLPIWSGMDGKEIYTSKKIGEFFMEGLIYNK